MSSKFLVIALSLGLTVSGANSYAQDTTTAPETKPPETKKEAELVKEKVQTGVLASQVDAGLAQSLDVPTLGATPGDEGGVLAANVSVVDKSTCVVKLINNGKKSYAVSYELVGKDSGGQKKLTRFFNSTIGPGKTITQRSSGCSSPMSLFVVVKTAKPL